MPERSRRQDGGKEGGEDEKEERTPQNNEEHHDGRSDGQTRIHARDEGTDKHPKAGGRIGLDDEDAQELEEFLGGHLQACCLFNIN